MESSRHINYLSTELLRIVLEEHVLYLTMRDIVAVTMHTNAMHNIETPSQLSINSKEESIRFAGSRSLHTMSSSLVLKQINKMKALKSVCKLFMEVCKSTKSHLPFMCQSTTPRGLSTYHCLRLPLPPKGAVGGVSLVMKFCVESNFVRLLTKAISLKSREKLGQDEFMALCLARTIARILQIKDSDLNRKSPSFMNIDLGSMLAPFGGEGAVFGAGRGCFAAVLQQADLQSGRGIAKKNIAGCHVTSADGLFWHVPEELMLETLRSNPVLASVSFGVKSDCLRFTDRKRGYSIEKNRAEFQDRFHRYLATSKNWVSCNMLRVTCCDVSPWGVSMESMAYASILSEALSRVESAACCSRMLNHEGLLYDLVEEDDVVAIEFPTTNDLLSRHHPDGPLWSAVQSSLRSHLLMLSPNTKRYRFSAAKFCGWLRWNRTYFWPLPGSQGHQSSAAFATPYEKEYEKQRKKAMHMAHKKICHKYMGELKEECGLTYARIQGVYAKMWDEKEKLMAVGCEGLK